MNNILDIKSPAEAQAQALKSDYGLENHGLTNLNKVYWNLPVEALYEEAVFRSEGKITRQGPLVVNTGKHTARAANDKFIVREASTEDHVWWGQYNRPYSPKNSMTCLTAYRAFCKVVIFLCRTVMQVLTLNTACRFAS